MEEFSMYIYLQESFLLTRVSLVMREPPHNLYSSGTPEFNFITDNPPIYYACFVMPYKCTAVI